ncbi:hypothetical protein KGM_214238 [Danaus plexippus plexippus]|uniref:Uncharacterized protein n=1 Tax=Danaus plexippus plexippus TaxID=278856 RepID=A0A212FPQ7_DANPL|nr:hypothetical protein KGM_214238 [Danaus plexippus plexippus]
MVSITAKKRINYIRIYNSQDRLQVKQEDQGKIIVVLKPTRWVRGAPEVCRVGETSSEFTSFITAMQFLYFGSESYNILLELVFKIMLCLALHQKTFGDPLESTPFDRCYAPKTATQKRNRIVIETPVDVVGCGLHALPVTYT